MGNINYHSLTTDQVRKAMHLYIKNRKLNDKNGLLYLLAMRGIHAYNYTRNELENMLIASIETDAKLYSVIRSDYTRNKIVEIVKKHKL